MSNPFKEGSPVWNFENPLYQKEINGINYRITKDNVDADPLKPYRLFAEKKLIGTFKNSEDAMALASENKKRNKGM